MEKSKAIAEKVVEIYNEFQTKYNRAGGKSVCYYFAHPAVDELNELLAIFNERFKMKGEEKIIGIACKLLKEELLREEREKNEEA